MFLFLPPSFLRRRLDLRDHRPAGREVYAAEHHRRQCASAIGASAARRASSRRTRPRTARAIAVCNGARPGNPHDTVREFLLLARIPHKKFLSPFQTTITRLSMIISMRSGCAVREETLGGLSGCTLRKADWHTRYRGAGCSALDDPTRASTCPQLRRCSVRSPVSRCAAKGSPWPRRTI